MTNRTIYLLCAMAAVVLIFAGDKGYQYLVEQPAAAHAQALDKLDAQIDAAEDIVRESLDAADRLVALENCSLPYDPELARSRYQDWLLSLVEAAELSQSSVNASTAVPVSMKSQGSTASREIYQRHGFTVSGQGTLQQVCRFLFDFYSGGHLHKILSLQLSPVGPTDLAVTVQIEALALTRCPRKGELAKSGVTRLAMTDINDYQGIVQRNLFSSEVGTALRQIQLTAVTFDKLGVPEAWFSVGVDEPARRVRRGSQLAVPSHEIEVLDIQAKTVLVEVDGAICLLQLGQTVQDALTPQTVTVN